MIIYNYILLTGGFFYGCTRSKRTRTMEKWITRKIGGWFKENPYNRSDSSCGCGCLPIPTEVVNLNRLKSF